MNFLFCKLPMDIIKYIVQFDEHFIIRKGEIISVIPKTDYRYNLLKFITFKDCIIEKFHDMIRYNYELYNLCNYKKRENSDLVQVTIFEKNNILEYVVWIGRQKKNNSAIKNKKQMYFIENPTKYHWKYTEYEYSRK